MGPRTDELAERVSVLRDGVLDGDNARSFAAQQLAAITHLPTGAAGGRSEMTTLPAGAGTTTRVEPVATTLLHVVAGQLSLCWGNELDQVARGGPGDTVIVPAGIAFRAHNAEAAETLQFVLMRGD